MGIKGLMEPTCGFVIVKVFRDNIALAYNCHSQPTTGLVAEAISCNEMILYHWLKKNITKEKNVVQNHEQYCVINESCVVWYQLSGNG